MFRIVCKSAKRDFEKSGHGVGCELRDKQPSLKGGNTMTEKKLSSRLSEVKALTYRETRRHEGAGERGAAGSSGRGDERLSGADRNERSSERTGYRAGYYNRGLVTQIGNTCFLAGCF